MDLDWKVLTVIGGQLLMLAFFFGGTVALVRTNREVSDRILDWLIRVEQVQHNHGERIQAIEAVCEVRHSGDAHAPVKAHRTA